MRRGKKDYGVIIARLRGMSDLDLCRVADQAFDGPWQRCADFMLRHERGYSGSVRTWLRDLQDKAMMDHNGGPLMAS